MATPDRISIGIPAGHGLNQRQQRDLIAAAADRLSEFDPQRNDTTLLITVRTGFLTEDVAQQVRSLLEAGERPLHLTVSTYKTGLGSILSKRQHRNETGEA